MKQISYTKIASLALATVALGGALTSCDKEKLLTNDYPEAFPTTQITFNVSEVLPLAVGMDSILVYTVGPEIATDKTVLFTSSDPTVATVDDNGKITALKVGQTFVRAVPAIGFGANASVQVNVIDEVIKAQEVKITALTEPSEDGYYYETDEIQLACEILPESHTYSHVTWTSENKEVASVDENGLVTCLKEGDAHIRCHTHDHSLVAGDYKFHVYKMQEVDHMDIKPLDGPICITQGNIKLDVTYYPEGATVGSVKWETSDQTIVDVKRGVITPKGWGNATITATAPSGNTATISVTVESGWYVWDGNWGWGNWTAGGKALTGETPRVQMAPAGGQNKWRCDLSYTPVSNFPFDWTNYNVLVMRVNNLKTGGANTLNYDAMVGNDKIKADLRAGRVEMSDGSVLLVWNAASKFKNQLTYGSPLNLKIADIPVEMYASSEDAWYEVRWIRTFKNQAEAEQFAKDEIAAGK